nr:gene transfer agent family protein [uncultured Celeribacter sp.]
MSRSASVTLDWADGTYPFALKIGQLEELQEKCAAGPWFIQWALQAALFSDGSGFQPPKDMSPSYVRETIRLGLIGGGMEAIAALKKVRSYASEGQLTENIQVAYAVISVALQGVKEDDPGKEEGEMEAENQTSPEGESGSPLSSETGPQLA